MLETKTGAVAQTSSGGGVGGGDAGGSDTGGGDAGGGGEADGGSNVHAGAGRSSHNAGCDRRVSTSDVSDGSRPFEHKSGSGVGGVGSGAIGGSVAVLTIGDGWQYIDDGSGRVAGRPADLTKLLTKPIGAPLQSAPGGGSEMSTGTNLAGGGSAASIYEDDSEDDGGDGEGTAPSGVLPAQVAEVKGGLVKMQREHSRLLEQMAEMVEWNGNERTLAEARLKSALWEEKGQSARLMRLEAALTTLAPIDAIAVSRS